MKLILIILCASLTGTFAAEEDDFGVIIEVSDESENTIEAIKDEIFLILSDGFHEHCDNNNDVCCGMVGTEYQSLWESEFAVTTPTQFQIDEFYPASGDSLKFRVHGKYNMEHMERHCTGYRPGAASGAEGEGFIDPELLHSVVEQTKQDIYEKHDIEIVDVYTDGTWELWMYVFVGVIGSVVGILLLILLAVGCRACCRNTTRADGGVLARNSQSFGFTNPGFHAQPVRNQYLSQQQVNHVLQPVTAAQQPVYGYTGVASRQRPGSLVFYPQASSMIRQPYYSWM